MTPGEHICVNDQSEYESDFVDRDHSCTDWEDKTEE